MTNDRAIYITESDMNRLRLLIHEKKLAQEKNSLAELSMELDRAKVVSPKDIPGNVVTMNTQVKLRDLNTNEEMVFTLVFPSDADIEQDKISVLAPIGIAMLGQKIGDEVEWTVPAGRTRLKVEHIFYQPEAAGHFHQ